VTLVDVFRTLVEMALSVFLEPSSFITNFFHCNHVKFIFVKTICIRSDFNNAYKWSLNLSIVCNTKSIKEFVVEFCMVLQLKIQLLITIYLVQ